MKRATLFLSYHLSNRVFDVSDPIANRDDCLRFFIDLKSELRNRGYDLATQDLHPVESSEFVIYHDFPITPLRTQDRPRSFLLIMEPPVVKQEAWKRKNWIYFNRIFTYDDSLVDNRQCFKLNYCHAIPTKFPDSRDRQKLCVTIVGRKTSKHPHELYSKRLEIIEWFDENRPDGLDVFGHGWEGYRSLKKGLRGVVLRQKKRLGNYKGTVDRKLSTLSRYKFAICFENWGAGVGYISEKIFDAFFAGTVPVYLGAPNIADHIPRETFIDYRDLGSPEALEKYLINLSEENRLNFVESAQSFLSSPRSDGFRSKNMACWVVDRILEGLPGI